jgi:hypothetical protein
VILFFIVVECLLVIIQLIWLSVKVISQQYFAKSFEDFMLELGSDFLPSLKNPEEYTRWRKRAEAFHPSVVRDYIEKYFTSPQSDELKDETIQKIRDFYTDMGFLMEDIRESQSIFWHRRLLAMRRLSRVATVNEKKYLLKRKSDKSVISTIAAQIVGKIGTADDILLFLKDRSLPKKLMEHPIFVFLKGISLDKFKIIMESFDQCRDGNIKKILLVTAALVDPPSCRKWLDFASKSPDIEVRIGAVSHQAN